MHIPTHACTHTHPCTHTHTHTPHLGYSHLLENLPSTCIADPRIGCPAGQIIQYMFVSQLSYRSNKLFVSQFYRSKEMKQLLSYWPSIYGHQKPQPSTSSHVQRLTALKIDWCQIIGLECLPALVTKAQETCLSLVPVECKTTVIAAVFFVQYIALHTHTRTPHTHTYTTHTHTHSVTHTHTHCTSDDLLTVTGSSVVIL